MIVLDIILFIGKSFPNENVCDCIQHRSWIPMMRWSERQFFSFFLFAFVVLNIHIEWYWTFMAIWIDNFRSIYPNRFCSACIRTETKWNEPFERNVFRYVYLRSRSIGSQTNIAWIICILLLKLFKLFDNFRKSHFPK